jgi:hypothetical protein
MLHINKCMWLIYYYDIFIKALYQQTVVGIPEAIPVDSSWTDECRK